MDYELTTEPDALTALPPHPGRRRLRSLTALALFVATVAGVCPVSEALAQGGPCIEIVDSGGGTTSYSTASAASAAVSDGDSLSVLCDLPGQTLSIEQVKNVSVAGEPFATLGGLQVREATGVEVENLAIEASAGSSVGILVDPGTSTVSNWGATCSISHVTVEVTGASSTGLLLQPNVLVEARELTVRNSGGVGSVVSGGAALEAERMVVMGSAGSGLVVHDGAVVAMDDAALVANGVVQTGWGIEAIAGSGTTAASLRNVVLGFNNGRELPGVSTVDISNWDMVLDSTDTLVGVPVPSAYPLAPPGVLYSVVEQGSSFKSAETLVETTPPTGLSPEAEQEWVDEVARQSVNRDNQFGLYGGAHPSLLDVQGVAIASVDPDPFYSCYSSNYDSLFARPIDYIVDGPAVAHGLVAPPVAYIDIRAALAAAKASGDTDGDGTIRVCVMPGLYGPGIEIDYSDFLVGEIATLPAFEIFSAYGPQATRIAGGPFAYHNFQWVSDDNGVRLLGPPDHLLPFGPGLLAVRIAGFRFSGSARLRAEFNPDSLAVPGSMLTSLNSHAELWRSEFVDNETAQGGGAVAAVGGTLGIEGTTFLRNIGRDGGGGVRLEGVTSAALRASAFVFNSTYRFFFVEGDGGAIQSLDSNLSTETSIFRCNGDYFSQVGCDDHPEFESQPPAGARPDVRDGAAIHSSGGAVVVSQVELLGNRSDGNGGAISSVGSELEIIDTAVLSNHSELNGGGLAYAGNSDLTLSGVLVHSNRSDVHGGGLFVNESEGVTIAPGTLSTRFYANTAFLDGGGAYFRDSSFIGTFAHFRDNRALSDGGGIALIRVNSTPGQVSASMDGGTFVANFARRHGGGVFAIGADLQFDVVTVSDNTIEPPATGRAYGAGVALMGRALGDQGAALDCLDCRIERNNFLQREGDGAGVYCAAAQFGAASWDPSQGPRPQVSLTGSTLGAATLADNQLAPVAGLGTLGGGAFVGQGCEMLLDQVLVSGNQASQGAGVALGMEIGSPVSGTHSSLEVVDSEFSGNVLQMTGIRPKVGGGIHVGPDGNANLSGTVLALNAAAQGGGLSCDGPASLSLSDVVLDSNTASIDGGGVWVTGCVLSHVGGSYLGNQVAAPAGDGGGAWVQPADGSALVFSQLEFLGNGSNGRGGAFFVEWPSGAGTSHAAVSNVLLGMNTSGEGAAYLRSDCGNGDSATAALSYLTVAGNDNPTPQVPAVGVRFEGGLPSSWTLSESLLGFNQDDLQYVAGEDSFGGSGTDLCDSGGLFDHGLLWNNGQGPVVSTFDPTRWSEVAVVNQDPQFIGDSSGSDPLFEDPLTFDFHLQTGSPALSAGSGSGEVGAFGGPGGSGWSCTVGCP